MNIPAFAVKRRQFTLVLFGALVAVGVSSMISIPRAEDPSFESPNFAVIAVLPGASPKDVEELVVDPIESAIGELDEIKRVRTTIQDGVAVIQVEFQIEVDSDRKYDEVIRQVNSKRSRLPSTLLSLEVTRFQPNNVAIRQLALVSETAPYEDLARAAERLQDRLESIPGIRDSKTWAYPERVVKIALDPERLARLSIPLDQVIRAVQSDNANIPGGSVELGARKLNVKTSGPYRSLAEVESTVIGGAQGKIIRLAEVASVEWSYEDQTYRARYDGQRAVFVTATLKDRQNIFRARDLLDAELTRFERTLPPTIALARGFDQGANVEVRLKGLTSDFLIAIALVLITLLPLGFRASVIVMISIPLSLAMGLSLLHFTGYSINQLSIVGFVIALGLLVDDSIVVTENITRHLRMGLGRKQAAIAGATQIGVAVLGCTATLLFAFLPILFLPGTAGAFIRSLPLAVVFTIAASLFVSITIIPLLASLMLQDHREEDGFFYRLMTKGIEASYRPVLKIAMRWPKLTTAASLGLFVLSLGLVPTIGFSLFPKAGTPQFLVRIETPEGSSLDETDAQARFVEATLRGHPEVKWTMASVGHGNPQIYYNVIPSSTEANQAEVFAETVRMRPEVALPFFERLRAELATRPNVRIELKEFENGPPVDAPIAIRLLGEDLGQLERLAAEVEGILRQTPGTREIVNPLATKKTDLVIRADATKAGTLGVPMAEVDRGIRMSLAGLEVGAFRTPEGDDRDILLTVSQIGKRPSLEALDRLSIAAVTGAAIPLRQLAEVGWESGPPLIQHYNRQRSVTVKANVQAGFNTDRVTQAVLAKLEPLHLPPGYRWVAAGEIESRQESFGGLGTAILVAIFGVLAVLILEFRTLKTTLVVASVIPLGVLGGLLALYFTGNTLSFTAVVGFIALIGIEVKNSILLVDFTTQLRAQGASVEEAIERAGETRFFPILLTSMTAIGGLLPLALGGSSLYSPLAWVMIGGLISSTVLSRLVTPVMYLLLAPAKLEDEGEEPVAPEGSRALPA
ncbi:MAG: efflux RND transporter permease subunit [Myxococcota bacterium]